MLLALDIGGTKLAAARIAHGAMVERRQLPMPADAAGFARAIDTLVDGWPRPRRVAVATTGYLHAGKVYPVNRDILSYWNGYPLAALLGQRFDCPVLLLNDGQAAAWGEYRIRQLAGAARTAGNLLFITLSTGVGGGMVLDHQLRAGPHGLAGHLGHAGVRLAPTDGARVCGCGRLGCLEMVASGTALARQAGAALGHPLDSRQLFALAAGHDRRAGAILDHAATAVAEAIAGLHMTLDLSDVVIGGSVGLAPGMLERLAIALDAQRLPCAPVLGAALLGPDAGLIGAATWPG